MSRKRLFSLFYLLVFLMVFPSLALAASSISGPTEMNQCDQGTFTITVTNPSGAAGPACIRQVTATLPSVHYTYVTGTSSVSVSGGGCSSTADPSVSGQTLTWDMDTLCGGTVQLDPGDSLTIHYDIRTDCDATSGSMTAEVTYNDCAGGASQTETSTTNVKVNPGALIITKTPSVISAAVGDEVTWTLTVKNTGLGTIKNVVVTDVLGAGLAYVSSSPAGSNSGQTTTWDRTAISDLAEIASGHEVSMDITATVTDCDNLDNTADAKWGCDGGVTCFDTSVNGGTAQASVQLQVKTPDLDYSPPDITFSDYCSGSTHVGPMTISNNGDGTAHNLTLCVNLDGFDVTDVSAGASYDAGSHCFSLPDLASGDSYDLSFDLSYTDWCSGSPARTLVWLPLYEDDCGNTFHPTVKTSHVSSSGTSPSLSVSKTGPAEVQIGDTATYHIHVAYTGPTSCGSSGTTGNISITDHVPDGFTVPEAGGGTWTPGADGTGGTITWSLDPADSPLDTDITLQTPGVDQCETYCFTTFTNSVEAHVTDCCGCDLSASDTQTTAIECSQLLTSDKTANPTTVEPCGQVTYTNTYTFGNDSSLSGVDLSDLSFEEEADNDQQFVTGTLQVTFDGNDITGCVSVTNNTPGGPLQLDFSGCSGAVQGKQLVITYTLQMTDQSQPSPACGDSYTFYSWSTLDLGITGGKCLKDGKLHETTQVTVVPPAMTVSLSGLPDIVEKCGTYDADITIDRTSTLAEPYDVIVRLNTDNYYIMTVKGYDGITPSGPTDHGTYTEWDYGDNFTSTDQAVIHLTVQKKCGGGSDLVASVFYDDACHDDDTPDETCSNSDTFSPLLTISGDLIIEKTPEVYYASENKAQWTIYVVNKGCGTSYNVWVDDILGSGLTYSNATVDNSTGVTITPNQDHNGGTINGVSILIDELAPGEKRAITLDADIVSCDNLTNDVSANWGCNGDACQTTVTDSSTVEMPTPNLVNTSTMDSPVNMCSQPKGVITLKNAGQIHLYHVSTAETLPAGLSYVTGSAQWRKNGGAWNSAGDPAASGQTLTWSESQIADLTDLAPGDTLEVEFTASMDCSFAGGNLTNVTTYEDPCGKSYTTSQASFSVQANIPQLSISKTRTDPDTGQAVPCGASMSWDIVVTNHSSFNVPVIWVEDTMDPGLTYDSSSGGNDSYHGYGGNSQLVTWEIKDLGAGASTTLKLTATSATSGDLHCEEIDNTVNAYWGSGTVDGSAQTKPGVDESGTCLSSTAVQDTSASTRDANASATVAVSPTSIDTCDSDATFTVTIKNPSSTTSVTNLDAVITLPNGLTYKTGTSTSSGCSSGPGSGDPVVSGQTLTYYDLSDTGVNLCNSLDAGGSISLGFDIHSDCFTGGPLRVDLYYYDCCGSTQHHTSFTQTINSSNTPHLTISKTPQVTELDTCGAGNAVTWTITVSNNGSGQADWIRVEDQLGDSLNYVSSTPAATSLGGNRYAWETGPLGAGSSATFTLTAAPTSPPDCDVSHTTNTAQVTWGCGAPNNHTCESGIMTADSAAIHLPDLSIGGASNGQFTCTADGSTSALVRLTIRNDGAGAVSHDFKVTVSDDHGWSTTGFYHADFNGALPINSHGEGTIEIPWPLDCMTCDSTLTAQVDLDDTICECNENNNTHSFTFHTPSHNLKVNAITAACSGDGTSLVHVEIGNDGCNAASNFTVTLKDDQGHSRDMTISNLAAGDTTTLNFTNWPTTCSPATVVYTATVDANDAICECVGTDNTVTYTYINPSPDLTADEVEASVSCSSDGNITGQIRVSISNNGNGPVNNDFRINVNDGQGWTDEKWYHADLGGPLPLNQGDSQTVTFNWARVFTATPYTCNFNITATVDSQGDICECMNGNNTITGTYHMPIPDIIIQGETLIPECLADGKLRIHGTVTLGNTGCGTLTQDVPVRFTLFDGTGCLVGANIAQWTEVFTGVSISSGGLQTFTVDHVENINLCTALSGTHLSILLEADYGNAICEYDGTNNILCVDRSIETVDLALIQVSPAATCVADGSATGTIEVQVGNLGHSDITTDFEISLTDSSGVTVTDTFTHLGGTLPIHPNQTQKVTFHDWQVDCSPCSLTFTATVDPNHALCECDSSNNSLTSAPYTIPIGDLTITKVTPRPACQNATVEVTVANVGCEAVPKGVAIQITGSLSVSGHTATALAPGASETVTLPLGNLSPGHYRLTVSVDPDDAVCECDGTNNTMDFSVDLTQPVCDIIVPDVVFSGMPAAISAEVRGGTPPYTFRWSDSCGGHFSSSTISNPMWTPSIGSAGKTCTLTLNLVDSLECVTTCSLGIAVRPVVPPTPGTVLKVDKKVETCAIHSGGITRYTIEIQNTGKDDMNHVRVVDTQPEYFSYVPGSSALDGARLPDPQVNGRTLVWTIGDLKAGESRLLSYQAVADADAAPGQYCNSVRASGTVQGMVPVTSNEATACVTVYRGGVPGGSCCLTVKEEPSDVTALPDVYFAFVDPYYVTEDAMFAAYASLHLWQSGHYPNRRFAERMKNYALSNIRELYLHGGTAFGLVAEGEGLWLPRAGAYVSREGKLWQSAQADSRIRPSQEGMELLALNASLREVAPDEARRLKGIIARKLTWLLRTVAQERHLPEFWTVGTREKNGEKEKVTASENGASRYQKAVLDFALATLSPRFPAAARLKRMLERTIDLKRFDRNDPKMELFFILALRASGRRALAEKKLQTLAALLEKGDADIKSEETAALAYYLIDAGRAKIKSRLRKTLEEGYLPPVGILTSMGKTATERFLRTRDVAATILASERDSLDALLFKACFKAMNEAGLFYRRRFSGEKGYFITTPLNYLALPNQVPLIPIISAPGEIPPIYMRKALVIRHTSDMSNEMMSKLMKQVREQEGRGFEGKSLGSASSEYKPETGGMEEGSGLFPESFMPMVSPAYQTRISSMLRTALGCGILGERLAGRKDVYAEYGKQIVHNASASLLTLMRVAPGFVKDKRLLLPSDGLALKGAVTPGERFTPLTTHASYDVGILADYLLAQKLLLGKVSSLSFYRNLLNWFRTQGRVPERVYLVQRKPGKPRWVATGKKARKVTVAELNLVFQDAFTKEILAGETGSLKPTDLLILKRFPSLVPYFKQELRDVMGYGQGRKGLDWAAARAISASLLGEDPLPYIDRLKDFALTTSGLPVARVERHENGVLYHTPVNDLILALVSERDDPGFEDAVGLLEAFTFPNWEIHGGEKTSYLKLLPGEILLVGKRRSRTVEPGDLVTMRVTAENRCPMGRARAMDLPQIILQASFDPSLMYVGTSTVPGLSVERDFFWSYRSLYEGDFLRYTYQALIPREPGRSTITGEIRAEGTTGYSEFTPDRSHGNRCEDRWSLETPFRVVEPKEIPVTVFLDENANGKQDPDETGLSEMTLRDSRGRIYHTDQDGVARVPVGARLRFLSLYLQGVSPTLMATTPISAVISDRVKAVAFGLTPVVHVTGEAFFDANGNGKRDPGEKGVEGVVVRVQGEEQMSQRQGVFEYPMIPRAWVKKIVPSATQPVFKGNREKIGIRILTAS